jgi:hypothetical protein
LTVAPSSLLVPEEAPGVAALPATTSISDSTPRQPDCVGKSTLHLLPDMLTIVPTEDRPTPPQPVDGSTDGLTLTFTPTTIAPPDP